MILVFCLVLQLSLSFVIQHYNSAMSWYSISTMINVLKEGNVPCLTAKAEGQHASIESDEMK